MFDLARLFALPQTEEFPKAAMGKSFVVRGVCAGPLQWSSPLFFTTEWLRRVGLPELEICLH